MNQIEQITFTDSISLLDSAIEQLNQIILGKDQAIRLAMTCLIADGHLLIEDLPGVGKTTLAHSLAKIVGLKYQRVQFTSDLLPADIIGVSIYSREQELFHFHPGPIFSEVFLADEINRATPRTQSALLEAMEENQVTIENETRSLSKPFFVIATQNPSDQIGTFPLPESQLDRFLMRISIGYPDYKAERDLLMGSDRREMIKDLKPVINPLHLKAIQSLVQNIHCSSALLDYIQDLIVYSRNLNDISNGLSPRAGLSLMHCAKAWALVHGHDHVLPEHVQAIFPSVTNHRLGSPNQTHSDDSIAHDILKQVAIP